MFFNGHGITNLILACMKWSKKLYELLFIVCIKLIGFIDALPIPDGPAPDDRIVRSFTIGHDASQYADNINAKQRKLDEQYGHWMQNAAEKE